MNFIAFFSCVLGYYDIGTVDVIYLIRRTPHPVTPVLNVTYLTPSTSPLRRWTFRDIIVNLRYSRGIYFTH
jgi:hypothetical protein